MSDGVISVIPYQCKHITITKSMHDDKWYCFHCGKKAKVSFREKNIRKGF